MAASTHGWKPDTQRIDLSGDVDSAHVELWLRKATRIQGTLRSSTGRPLVNVQVYAISIVRLPVSEVSSASLRLLRPEGGFGASIDHVKGTAQVKFVYDSLTDSEGRFDIGVAMDGEVVLVAYPMGHAPLDKVLGVLRADLMDLDVVVERRRERRFVTLVANGKPLPEKVVNVVDMSLLDGDAQPGIRIKSDSEGRVPTLWLLKDRAYHFCVGEFYGNVIWDGRKVLDVAKDLVPLQEFQAR